ncbi:MAG: hypothetical protein JXA20_17870 [Spirochaetes bacterium]|nr:hypothetical protein [Spirochaetota bacterium]
MIRPIRLLKAAVAAGTVSLAVNLAIVAAAPRFGASLLLLAPDDTGPRPLQVMDMIPECYVVSAAAALLLYGLGRLVRRPWPVFVVAVIIVTAAWTTGPASHGADAATKIALSSTHMVIAVSILLSNYLLAVGPALRSGPAGGRR